MGCCRASFLAAARLACRVQGLGLHRGLKKAVEGVIKDFKRAVEGFYWDLEGF